MSLVERLGFKTLNELYSTLDSNEIMEWLAYDMLSNDEWREGALKEREMARQAIQSLNEEADKIKEMFMRMANGNI